MADEQVERVTADRAGSTRWFSPWRGLGCLALIGLALFILFSTGTRVSSKRKATRALLYLETAVKQVAWDEITSDDVYIGLSGRPDNLSEVIGTAAISGNQATGHAYTAWALDASVANLGWRPGDPGLICSAMASDGRVQSDTCQPFEATPTP